MSKIRKDDDVIVLTGKYKGKTGKVLRFADTGKRIVVEGINMIKKHVKPNPQKNQTGGIVEKEASIHISNVALYNPTTKKADRVGYKFLEDKSKVRIFKSNQEQVTL